MAKKASRRDILIEQCLQDAKYERLDEGWWDDIKANVRGAGEWLKQDAKDSFKLRNKDDIKTKRTDAKQSGKIKSYANSLAKTMSDYKKNGGTLGQDIENIDDAINRLNLVANGKAPRGRYRSNSNIQRQNNAGTVNQSQPSPTQQTTNSFNKPTGFHNQSPTNNSSRSITSTSSNNSPAQSTMLDTINNPGIQNSNSEFNSNINDETNSNSKDRFDKNIVKNRAKNIKKISKQRAKEEADRIRAEKIRNGKTLGQRISKGMSTLKDKAANVSKNVKKGFGALKDRFAQPKVSDSEVVYPEPSAPSEDKNELGPLNPNIRPIRRAKGRVIDGDTIENNTNNSALLPSPGNELAIADKKDRLQKALPGSGTYIGDFDNKPAGTTYTGSAHSQTDKGDVYIGGLQPSPAQPPALKNKQALLGYTPDEKSSEEPSIPTKKKKKRPLEGLRTNIDSSKLAKGRKLKTNPAPTKRKRILTAKNALDNERSQENMRKMVDANPDMFMYDSYNPYKNTKGQIKMLDTF